MNERDLFSILEKPPAQAHSATSLAAAQKIAPHAGTLRDLVLLALRKHGPQTDEQLQMLTGLCSSTERPRRVELVAQRLVRDSGRKMATKSGRLAVLWEAVR